MKQDEITITETFTRDQMLGQVNPQGNEVLAGQILARFRRRGVPLVGVLGFIAVEWGTLTIEHDDGLDGDEWKWTWTGKPVPPEFMHLLTTPGRCLRLDEPLALKIAAKAAEDDEL